MDSLTLHVKGLPDKGVLLEHFSIDQKNSNAYTLWLKMGKPQKPDANQIQQLQAAGQLHMATSPQWVKPQNGALLLPMQLDRQAVSLLRFTW